MQEKLEEALQENVEWLPLFYNSLAVRNTVQLAAMLKRSARENPSGFAVRPGKQEFLRWEALRDSEIRQAGFDPQKHREFLNEFYAGEFPGSFAGGKRTAVSSDGGTGVRGSAANLCGVRRQKEFSAYSTEMGIKRLLLLYKVSAAIGKKTEFAPFPPPAFLKEWQKAWIQDEISRVKAVRQEHRDIWAAGPGSVLKTWNDGVLGFAREDRLLILANFTETVQHAGAGCLQPFARYGALQDLLSGTVVRPENGAELGPYECFWLAAK